MIERKVPLGKRKHSYHNYLLALKICFKKLAATFKDI